MTRAMSWARSPRKLLTCHRYSRAVKSPNEQCTVRSKSSKSAAAAQARSTIAAKLPLGSSPSRSPLNESEPTSSMVRPASMSGTHESS